MDLSWIYTLNVVTNLTHLRGWNVESLLGKVETANASGK